MLSFKGIKMKNIVIPILTIVLIINIEIGLSQEKINQDVKVVKAYTPTISDAYKVNYMPVLDDSVATQSSFNYRILSTSVITNYKPTPISAAQINSSRKEYLDKSFIKGGVGNYSTAEAELGYNILENEKYVLGLNIGHISSLGEITLENDNTVDAPFHNTWAAANFMHFFDDKTFSLDLGFMHNKYHYYGYQTLDPEGAYWLPDGSLTSGSVFMPDVDQRLSGFEVTASICNNIIDKRKTSYKASAGFNTFSNLTGVSQNGLVLKGQLYRPINDLALWVDAEVASYKTSVPDTLGPMYTFNDRGLTLIKVNPSVMFTFDNASLKVGMLIAGIIDTEGDDFYVTPDILGELTVVDGIVSVYGGVVGKVILNDYRSIMYENAFASADVNVKSALYGLNFIAGVKGNFSSSTSFSAGVEYGFFNDEHFWTNKQYASQTVGADLIGEQHYSNLFDVVYDDGSLLKVKGELSYKPKKGMLFSLNGAFFGWNLDNLEAAWHKPELELGADGRFSILDNLHVNAGITMLGKRQAYDTSLSNNQKELKGIVDLNIGAEYNFSKQWSFWANLNNIAAAKYYQWNGYPMQGLNAKAGVVFSF